MSILVLVSCTDDARLLGEDVLRHSLHASAFYYECNEYKDF